MYEKWILWKVVLFLIGMKSYDIDSTIFALNLSKNHLFIFYINNFEREKEAIGS